MKRASYQSMVGGRYFMLFVMVVLGIAGIFLIVKSIQGGHQAPPILFAVAFVAIWCWNGYWWLWRVSYRLEVDGAELRWMTPLRSGSVPVSDITAIRPTRLTPQLSILEIPGRPAVMVQTIRGFSDFAEYLSRDTPIQVSTGVLSRWNQSFGRSGFRQDGGAR